MDVWIHAVTNYVITFRPIEGHKIQNHNCEHYLRFPNCYLDFMFLNVLNMTT
jgi:hypothetical protein